MLKIFEFDKLRGTCFLEEVNPKVRVKIVRFKPSLTFAQELTNLGEWLKDKDGICNDASCLEEKIELIFKLRMKDKELIERFAGHLLLVLYEWSLKESTVELARCHKDYFIFVQKNLKAEKRFSNGYLRNKQMTTHLDMLWKHQS